ncbi:hypothetical protein [uncultured Anaerobiospirillum sp.]|uniref:hypothetical protein n=1 Tax=uncultured Anaerobiospirillum sp. TaxID=265728 RepID=UPI00280553EE|nr:hypothetical protein [uncultured Anaerobiospirillum sp.]
MRFLIIATLIFVCAISNAKAETKTTIFLGAPVSGSLDKFVSTLEQQGFYSDEDLGRLSLVGDFLGRTVALYPFVNTKNELWKVNIIFLGEYSAEQVVEEYNKIYTLFVENNNYKLNSGSILTPIHKYNGSIIDQFVESSIIATNPATFYQKSKNDESINDMSLIKIWIAPSLSMNNKYNIIAAYENHANKPQRPDF